MVILCGSLVTLMSAQVLNYESPLHGRRTAQIHMRPLPFRFYGDFFENKNRRELVEFYSVTGGRAEIHRAVRRRVGCVSRYQP